MIRGILFDFDCTLSNRLESAYYMYRWCLHEIFPDMDVNSIDFEARVQRCMLWDEYGTINKRHVFNKIKEKWAPDLDVESWIPRRYENFHNYQELLPDAEPVLQEPLQKYRLGIVSNGDGRLQSRKIDVLELRKYFEVILISQDFGADKPERSIYDEAAHELHLPNEEIAFVGDTFDTDILGAYKAGMLPVWYNNEHRVVTMWNVLQAHDFNDLRKIFLK